MYIGVKVFQCDKRKTLVPLWLSWETSTKALAICNKFFFRKGTIYNSNFPNLHTLILLTFTVNVGNSNPSFLRFSFANYFMVSIYFTKYRSITWVNFKNQLHIRGKSMNLYLPSSKVSFSKLTKCILWTQVSYFSWWITVRLLNTNHLPNLGHRVKFFYTSIANAIQCSACNNLFWNYPYRWLLWLVLLSTWYAF